MRKRDLERFCEQARKLGAVAAKPIQTHTVCTAPWVRLKCQYGCGGYGERLTCPPHSPTPDQTRAVLDQYTRAILVHGDENTDISAIVVAIEREAFLAGYYKAFSFGSGPCRLCATCDVSQPCRNNEQARPAMEAAGIDVFQTARSNGFDIEVLTATQCRGNYFGLVLID